MRTRRTILATAAVAAAAVAAATGAAAKSVTPRSVPCTLAIFAQGPPANGTGIQFGRVNCPRPYGKGVHFDTYALTPTGPGRGTLAVRFKNYFDRGTRSGTAALTFAATSPTNITYTGDVTISGGTGAFSHLTAREKIQCTTTDGGAHKSCTVNPATPRS